MHGAPPSSAPFCAEAQATPCLLTPAFALVPRCHGQERAERLKAKKAAKKQQKAAKRQQQLEAAAAEQRQREEEEARRAAEEAERRRQQQAAAAAAAAKRRDEELLQQRLEDERQRRRQSQQAQQASAGPASPATPADGAAETPPGRAASAGRAQQAQQQRSEREPLQGPREHAQGDASAAACGEVGKQGSKVGPASPQTAEGQLAAPAMTPPRTAAKPQHAEPAAQGKPASPAPGSLANALAAAGSASPAAAPSALPGAAPAGKPITRAAPWAGMAAARTATPTGQAAAALASSAQQQQPAPPAHNITRPAHFGGPSALPPGSQLAPQLASAATLGLALPRWSPPVGTAVQRQQALQAQQAHLLQQQMQAQRSQLLSSLAALPAVPALHRRLPAALPPHSPVITPTSMHQAVPPVSHALATSVPLAAGAATSALLSSSLGAPTALSQLAAGMAPAAQLSSSAPGFVPLFGLNLPTLSGASMWPLAYGQVLMSGAFLHVLPKAFRHPMHPTAGLHAHCPFIAGLGVDWSMPTGVAAAASTFGSPARQPPAAYAAAPPGAASAQQPLSAAFTGATVAPVGPVAGGLVGSFSPSDASSIESSSEAEDLLAGLHGLHTSRPPSAGGMAAAAAALARTPVLAAAPAKLPVPAPPANSVADADGIDDVLRLQPWLEQ